MILRALVKTPVGLINILTTHFSLSSSARKRNTLEVWDFVSTLTEPVIILGDFNCEPDSEAFKFFTGELELNGKKGNFKDAWRELNPTVDDKDGWTYNTLADSPRKRIDFLFYRGLTPKKVEIFPYDAEAPTQPSDHRPIFVDFSIP
jgi:endonuclease/exonuclease/phosphatase (EEP) superfamily protein YafD